MFHADLILLHAPSVYDFRKKPIFYGPVSDVIPSTQVFEMYPVGFMTLQAHLQRHGHSVRIINIALKMLRSRRFDAEKELRRCEEQGIRLIGFFDDEYPSNLNEIYDPPLIMYTRGDLASFHEASFAIVGSRRPSIYGEDIAEHFAAKLSRWGLTIVS